VSVCIVRYVDSRKQPDERIACAMLYLLPGTPSTWETAGFLSPAGKAVTKQAITEYSVDSATACFMDADAARQIATLSNDGDDTFAESLPEATDATYVHTRSWGNMILDPTTGLNVIAFSSGWGDGAYTSYWGLDTAGQVVCLLTDFRVLATKS
jgi:hypothetical protein